MQKNRIIAVLIIITIVSLWFGFNKQAEIKTVTKTKIEYIPQEEKVENTQPTSVEIQTIKVPVYKNSHTTDTIYLDKEVKKYSYRDSLPNGIITATILADNIYSRSVKLNTFNKEITTTTDHYIVKSMLFLDVGVNKHIKDEIRDINIGVNYTRKDKWRIGFNTGYDFTIKQPFAGFKIGIPLN